MIQYRIVTKNGFYKVQFFEEFNPGYWTDWLDQRPENKGNPIFFQQLADAEKHKAGLELIAGLSDDNGWEPVGDVQ